VQATGNRLDQPGQEQQGVQLRHVRRKEAGSGLARGFALGCFQSGICPHLSVAFCTDMCKVTRVLTELSLV